MGIIVAVLDHSLTFTLSLKNRVQLFGICCSIMRNVIHADLSLSKLCPRNGCKVSFLSLQAPRNWASKFHMNIRFHLRSKHDYIAETMHFPSCNVLLDRKHGRKNETISHCFMQKFSVSNKITAWKTSIPRNVLLTRICGKHEYTDVWPPIISITNVVGKWMYQSEIYYMQCYLSKSISSTYYM